MVLLDIIVLALVFVFFLLFLSEIALPMAFGMPLFPDFRKSTPMKEEVSKAEKELEEQTELVRLNEQLVEIYRRKAELEKK